MAFSILYHFCTTLLYLVMQMRLAVERPPILIKNRCSDSKYGERQKICGFGLTSHWLIFQKRSRARLSMNKICGETSSNENEKATRKFCLSVRFFFWGGKQYENGFLFSY